MEKYEKIKFFMKVVRRKSTKHKELKIFFKIIEQK